MIWLVSDEDLAAEAADSQDEFREKTYDAGAEDEADDTFRDEDCELEVKEGGGHLLTHSEVLNQRVEKRSGKENLKWEVESVT